VYFFTLQLSVAQLYGYLFTCLLVSLSRNLLQFELLGHMFIQIHPKYFFPLGKNTLTFCFSTKCVLYKNVCISSTTFVLDAILSFKIYMFTFTRILLLGFFFTKNTFSCAREKTFSRYMTYRYCTHQVVVIKTNYN
jgi:hypothetical protein